MKIYQEENSSIRYYYELKFTDRVKTVCLDVRKENANKRYVEGQIKNNWFGKDATSMHFDTKFYFKLPNS